MASSNPSFTPSYAFLSTSDGIEYTIQIPNLRVVKPLFGPKLPRNGEIQCEITETGFSFSFFGSNDLAGKNYILLVPNFPGKICPHKSCWKPRNGAVDVKLRVLDNPKEVEAKLREERLTEETESS